MLYQRLRLAAMWRLCSTASSAKKTKTKKRGTPKKPVAQYEKKRAEGILLGSGKPSVAPASIGQGCFYFCFRRDTRADGGDTGLVVTLVLLCFSSTPERSARTEVARRREAAAKPFAVGTRRGMADARKCRQRGCTKTPSFGVAGTKKREVCREHATEGMVDLIKKKCIHHDCTKIPSFGVEGTKKVEFCRGHAKEGMTDLRSRKKCAHHDCTKQPSFGVEGTKNMEFCREHTKEGMVYLRNKTCVHHGCAKRPSHGLAGTKKVEFCSDHANEGMVDLRTKKCAHHDCNKCAWLGVAGTKKREFCRQHAKDGMVNTNSKKCAHKGCSKQPSFGVAGTKKVEFCREHAKNEMIDLISKKCSHQGCDKGPSFGAAGTKKREFCRDHAKNGMVNIHTRKCAHQSCNKQPSYGEVGAKKAEFCRMHAGDEMVDLISKKCSHQGCNKVPSFGVVGTKKREFCKEHAKDGMINLNHKKCTHRGCSEVASHGVAGTKKVESCREHASAGMIDLISKECAHQGCRKGPSFGVAGTKKREFCSEHAKAGMVSISRERAVQGTNRGNGASATPPRSRPGVAPISRSMSGGGSSNTAGRRRKIRSPPSSQLTAPRRSGIGGSCSELVSFRGGHVGASGLSPGGGLQGSAGESSASFTGNPPSQSDSTAGVVDGTPAAAVKKEGLVLSSRIVMAGDGLVGSRSAAASHVVEARNKRKGRASPSDEGSSSSSSSGEWRGNSSGERRGKRARQAFGDDVVLLEPVDQAALVAATGRPKNAGRPGSHVAVKVENWWPGLVRAAHRCRCGRKVCSWQYWAETFVLLLFKTRYAFVACAPSTFSQPYLSNPWLYLLLDIAEVSWSCTLVAKMLGTTYRRHQEFASRSAQFVLRVV